jgi:hypothetical protein
LSEKFVRESIMAYDPRRQLIRPKTPLSPHKMILFVLRTKN